MIFSHPPDGSLAAIFAWAKRHIDEMNRFHMPVNRWPTFADNAAAAAGNLKVGEPYATPDGQLRRRSA